VVVVRAREEGDELELLELRIETLEPRGELGREFGVGFVFEELVGRLEILERALEPVVAVDPVPEPGEALGQLLAAGGIVPERRVGRLPFELGELRAGAVDVKGTPSRRRSVRAAIGDVRTARSCPDRSAPDPRSIVTGSMWRTSPRLGAGRHRPAHTGPLRFVPGSQEVPEGDPERKEGAMSAQGGTLGRLGARHVPIWPMAVLLAAAIAAAIALSTLGQGVSRPVDQIATTDAVFEEITYPRGLEHAGAYPAAVGTTQMIRSAVWAAQADAYIGSLVARAPLTGSAIWKAQADAYVGSLVAAGEGVVTHAVGLENPGAYAPPATAYVSGLENPGAYLGDGASVSTPKVGGPERVVVNGDVCHQCL
jgi:hypothetical protein